MGLRCSLGNFLCSNDVIKYESKQLSLFACICARGRRRSRHSPDIPVIQLNLPDKTNKCSCNGNHILVVYLHGVVGGRFSGRAWVLETDIEVCGMGPPFGEAQKQVYLYHLMHDTLSGTDRWFRVEYVMKL
jgi:hypothetical protein